MADFSGSGTTRPEAASDPTMCDPSDHVFGWSSNSHYYCECGFQMGTLAELDTQEAYGLLSELADVGFLRCERPLKPPTHMLQNCGECLPCRATRYLECVGDIRINYFSAEASRG